MDVLAPAALAVSLVSVVVALRAHQKDVKVSTYSNATDLTLAVDRLFIEHPELRPLFYANAPIDATVDRNLALAVAEFVTDVFECLWDTAKTYEDDDRKAWSDYIGDMYGSSPVLREFYDSCPAWYPALSSWVGEQGVRTASALPPAGP